MAQRLHRLCIGRSCRVIESGGKPYLVRVYLWHDDDGSRTYLHRFVSGDAERWIHDHPFDGTTEVLSGGYTEEILTEWRRPLPGTELVFRERGYRGEIPSARFHRIVGVLPDTWTLFRHAAHKKDWGFLDRMAADGATALVYHNPFPQTDSAGAHWWERPDVLIYPPPGLPEIADADVP